MFLRKVPKGARMYCIREMEVIRVNAFWKENKKGWWRLNNVSGELTQYSKIESMG